MTLSNHNPPGADDLFSQEYSILRSLMSFYFNKNHEKEGTFLFATKARRHKENNVEGTKPMKSYAPLSEKEEAIASAIVNSAFQVHKALGPGLLEKVYEVCFCHELKKTGLHVERQVGVPIHYDGMIFDEGLRLDVLVDGLAICEMKAVEKINPVWEAQILSHLKLTNKRLGFLINFSVPLIKDGIKRFVL